MKKKLILFVLLMVSVNSELRSDYAFNYYSSYLQILSFHIGSDRNFQSSDSKTSLVLGGSIGLTYIFDWNYGFTWPIYGLRFKYLYFDRQNIHSLGAVGYLHNTYATFFSIAMGMGALLHSKENTKAIGGYAEAGIALWKTLPINVDVFYRINIYNHRAMRDYALGNFTHHLNVVFTFF